MKPPQKKKKIQKAKLCSTSAAGCANWLVSF
jgi:hypothetical protein